MLSCFGVDANLIIVLGVNLATTQNTKASRYLNTFIAKSVYCG